MGCGAVPKAQDCPYKQQYGTYREAYSLISLRDGDLYWSSGNLLAALAPIAEIEATEIPFPAMYLYK